MSKNIKLSQKSGLIAGGRGLGVQHLDENGKGFKTIVVSKSLDFSGTDNNELIVCSLPAYAIINTISIKVTRAALDDGAAAVTDFSAAAIDGIKFGSNTINLDSSHIVDGKPGVTAGVVYTYDIAGANSDGAGDSIAAGAFEQSLSTGASVTTLTLVEAITGYNSSEDTLPAISVIVSFTVPLH